MTVEPRFADRACQSTVTIVENVQLACDTYRVRFQCPELARRIVPGQFVMLRLAGCDDPLLGRPLALYDTVLGADGRPDAIDVVYGTKAGFEQLGVPYMAHIEPPSRWGE